MDITLDKKDSNIASIKIKLNEADYQSKVDEKIKGYSKKAQIKGFRPGKVPQSVIKKMYGKSVLVEELNKILSENLNKYIGEEKLDVLGSPLPSEDDQPDLETQSEFEFTYDLGLAPQFEVKLSQKDKLGLTFEDVPKF